ncbi:MAG: trypsin-like peptidase domain-containing protein [Eubacteriales bacterium]|nr:trypsin-like peptidase domain-containing protein [Eubacteriales bacterium]
MKMKKYLGITAAVMVSAGVLGVMAYGAENESQDNRITIGSDSSTDAGETEKRIEFGDITATEAETEEATTEEATTEAITEVDEQSDTQGAYLPNIKQITKNAMPAIVAITNQGVENISFFGRNYQQNVESAGSGIIVAKSDTELLIATNNHVVDGAEQLTVCFDADVENEKDKLVSAQVKGTDSSLDLAVVAVKLEDISKDVADQIGIIKLGDSDKIEVGDWSIAIGNALGYGQSVTFGVISALDREISVSTDDGVVTNNMIQTDAAINFGNSGGALLDENGRLIGINSAKAAQTGVEGMGYAIPINTAKPIIEDLMNQTTRTKVDADKAGALGIVPADVSEEARQIYNIPAGAFVYELTDNSAAEDAGIQQGDIITKLEKTAISSKAELFDRMQYYEAGETIDVTVKRMGDGGYEEKTFQVTLGKKSDLPTQDQQNDRNDNDDSQKEEDEQDDNDDYYDNSDLNDFFRYFGGNGF